MNNNIDPKSMPSWLVSIVRSVHKDLDLEVLESAREMSEHRQKMRAKAEAQEIGEAVPPTPEQPENSIEPPRL